MTARSLVSTPHFEIPLRLDADGDFAVVEEGSTREVGQCVTAILRTPLGHRVLQRGLGVEDPTHLLSGEVLQQVVSQIREFEPRAEFEAAAQGVSLDEFVDQVWVDVFGEGSRG